MTVYVVHNYGRIYVAVRAVSEDGMVTGRCLDEVEPGAKLYGKTYEEWAEVPNGAHEIPEDTDCSDDHPAPHRAIQP